MATLSPVVSTMFTGSETSKPNQLIVSGTKCSLQSFSGKSEIRVTLKANAVCASTAKYVAVAELQRSFTQAIFSVLILSVLTFPEFYGKNNAPIRRLPISRNHIFKTAHSNFGYTEGFNH